MEKQTMVDIHDGVLSAIKKTVQSFVRKLMNFVRKLIRLSC